MRELCLLDRQIVDEMQAAGVLSAEHVFGERDGKVAIACDPALPAWCRVQATRADSMTPEKGQAYLMAAEVIEAALRSG